MNERLDDALADTPECAAGSTRSGTRPAERKWAAVALVLLALAISACATRSARDDLPPLESTPSPAWGSATVDLEFYELRRTTQSELREEIRSIRAARGMRNYGDTQWRIETGYDFATAGDDCRPTRVDVSLALRVTLPRLRDPDAVSPTLRADWRDFISALRAHEAQHKQIAIECAEQVSRELAAVGTLGCDRLGETMQAITEEVTATCHNRNAEYDLRTGHGASEGVRF